MTGVGTELARLMTARGVGVPELAITRSSRFGPQPSPRYRTILFDLWFLAGASYRNRTDDLRITRVFSCAARRFKPRASFEFTGCC